MTVESWESERACLFYPPGPWDIDASMDSHRTGASICRSCPVVEQCEAQTQRRFDGRMPVDGLYAGFMWSSSGRDRGKHSVTSWHKKRRHSAGQDAQETMVAGVEEKQCAKPGCVNLFPVGPRNATKLYCSSTCSQDHRYQVDKGRRRERRLERKRSETA